jgi:transcriptional regulator with XRE-family HTH domain
MKIFSERLKRLREEKNNTQAQMAKLIDKTLRHYQDIEYGKVNVSMTILIALADYFDVSMDYLAGRTDNSESHK